MARFLLATDASPVVPGGAIITQALLERGIERDLPDPWRSSRPARL